MANSFELPEGQDSFKTNEVCKLARVQPYMLKYWGSYFPGLEAETSGVGQRLYSRAQVETILEISRLLSEESLTLPGARKRIEAMGGGEPVGKPAKPKVRPQNAREKKEKAESAPKVKKEVDKKASEDVKTLLAALREIRGDLLDAVAELRK